MTRTWRRMGRSRDQPRGVARRQWVRYVDQMEASTRRDAAAMRHALDRGAVSPAWFRAALVAVPPRERDPWFDAVLGLDGPVDDDPTLPAGCVPYLPCSVDAVLRLVHGAAIGPTDVFVDVGSGVGRAALLVHLLTGARVIGIEIQPALVAASRRLAASLGIHAFTAIEGDAAVRTDSLAAGTVFLLYCPFGGARLHAVAGALDLLASTQPIRLGCIDLPLPACRWLTRVAHDDADLVIYRSPPNA